MGDETYPRRIEPNRRGGLYVTAGLLLLILGIGGFYFATQHQPASTETPLSDGAQVIVPVTESTLDVGVISKDEAKPSTSVIDEVDAAALDQQFAKISDDRINESATESSAQQAEQTQALALLQQTAAGRRGRSVGTTTTTD